MNRLKRAALQWTFDRYYAWRYPEFVRTPQVIALDYAVRPRARYGYGSPPHPALASLFARDRWQYAAVLDRLATYKDEFDRIPLASDPEHPDVPCWRNPYFTLLDAAALYGILSDVRPNVYLEIGSGHSSRFARQAIREHSLPTAIVSIDPHPRVEVSRVADEIISERLEDVNLDVFDRLQSGDIVFLDGSHRVFENSDTSVFFLDVLPRLAPGVLVHLHDIFLPDDYPPAWLERYYSEQYLLAVLLLSGGSRLRPYLPNAYVSRDPELSARARLIWRGSEIEPMVRTREEKGHVLGSSFWGVWSPR